MARQRATKEEYVAIKLAQLAEILYREEDYMSAQWQMIFAMTDGAENTRARSAGVTRLMLALASLVGQNRVEGMPTTPEEPTTTPEDTLREAGVSSKRQARYQRRMSSLLARRT